MYYYFENIPAFMYRFVTEFTIPVYFLYFLIYNLLLTLTVHPVTSWFNFVSPLTQSCPPLFHDHFYPEAVRLLCSSHLPLLW